MILVVSTCKWKLSEEEFVRPIIEIVDSMGFEYRVLKYLDRLNFGKYSKVIITGTALRDFDYLNYVNEFRTLREYSGSVLGICAGYQIIAKVFGNELSNLKKIGVYEFEFIKESKLAEGKSKAYFLHNLALTSVNGLIEPLAFCGNEICVFKVKDKEFYGTSFHPEVLNREIIVNFLKI